MKFVAAMAYLCKANVNSALQGRTTVIFAAFDQSTRACCQMIAQQLTQMSMTAAWSTFLVRFTFCWPRALELNAIALVSARCLLRESGRAWRRVLQCVVPFPFSCWWQGGGGGESAAARG